MALEFKVQCCETAEEGAAVRTYTTLDLEDARRFARRRVEHGDKRVWIEGGDGSYETILGGRS